MDIKKKHRLEIFLHFLTAVILYLKGWDKINHHHPVPGYIIFSLATIVLVIAFFGGKLGISHKTAKPLCFLIESAALFITTYVFFDDNKKYFPYLYLLAAIMYLVAFVVAVRKQKHAH